MLLPQCTTPGCIKRERLSIFVSHTVLYTVSHTCPDSLPKPIVPFTISAPNVLGNRRQGLPPSVVHSSDPVIWIGPHAALGLNVPGALQVVDVLTGATQVRAQFDSHASIQAVSGRSVAWKPLTRECM
jgi:hypothetical protein